MSRGSTNFRRLALVDHGISLEHTDAIKADQDSLNAAPIFASATDQADKTMKAAYLLMMNMSGIYFQS